MDGCDSKIAFRDVHFSYDPKEPQVLSGLNFDVKSGQTLAIVGESGCGKSTVLSLINGVLKPSRGTVTVSISSPFPQGSPRWRRRLGYCIQGNLLFPHMTLRENVELLSRKENVPDNQIRKRRCELAVQLKLPDGDAFWNKKPREISGGQQQRVSLVRALFSKPDLLLMDEPFGALDPLTRNELQDEFLQLQKRFGLTIVLVTHDLTEALKMGETILLLRQGCIEQHSDTKHFVCHPETEYVQQFNDIQLKTFKDLQRTLGDWV